MQVKEEFAEAQRRFGLLSFYDKFEHIVILILTALIAIFIVFAVWNLALKIFQSIAASTFDPTDYTVFQAVFGMIVQVRLHGSEVVLGVEHQRRGGSGVATERLIFPA
jgi:hypothetical protein